MVTAFLLIDAILLVTWGALAPFYTSIQVIYKTENVFADTVMVEQAVRCNCNYFIHLLIGLCCYKGILLLIGIFLAWQTKNAKIQVQNEAKQVAVAIYNVFAVSIIGIICVSVLLRTTRHQALYVIVALCILICTTYTLLLVFVPKVSCVYINFIKYIYFYILSIVRKHFFAFFAFVSRVRKRVIAYSKKTCLFLIQSKQIRSILYPENDKAHQNTSGMRNEIYLRHSQRQYTRSPHRPNREMSELSSTFSTGTLNTQLSVDSITPASGNKDNTNTHIALQDTLSGGSVVSYPTNFLATSNASTTPIFANIRATQDFVDAPIESIESKKSSPLNELKNEENRDRQERDSGLGDESPRIEHIILKFGDVTQGMDIIKVEEENEDGNFCGNSHVESESNTPTSSAGMLGDEDSI